MTAPSGGFGAVGSSGGSGVSVFMFQRTRIAVLRLEEERGRPPVAASTCRSGVMSSRIQNARPCVATTRSSPLNAMSRTDVGGRFSCSDCQWSPSSNETKIAGLGAGEEQARALRILAHGVDVRRRREAGRDARPRPAAIVGAVDVRRHVVELVRVDRHVRGVGIEARRLRSTRPWPTALSSAGVTSVQCSAAVGGQLHEAVVGADPDRPAASGDGAIV